MTNLTVGYQLETLSPYRRLMYYGGSRGLPVRGEAAEISSI
jgi:hypothetical protein